MKVAKVEAALHASPFRPFELRLNGEAIVVCHPEQVLLAENKTTVVVDVGDRIHIFNTNYITKLTLLRRGRDSSSIKAA